MISINQPRAIPTFSCQKDICLESNLRDRIQMIATDKIVWAFTASAFILTATVLTANPFTFGITAAALVSLGILAFYRKGVRLQITAFLCLCKEKLGIQNYHWIDKINDHLLAGGLPLKNRNHTEILQKNKIDTVISLLEPFERKSDSLFIRPVREKEWEKVSIRFHSVACPDFEPISLKKMDEVADLLHQELKAKRKVYIHCKAGVGRTPIAICAYLIKHKKMKADTAMEFIKKKRPSISLNKKQKERILSFENLIKNRDHSA